MTVVGFEGGLGSGKTLKMVSHLKRDAEKGRKIFANFKLYGIKYTPLNVLDLMANPDLKNVSIAIDEITVFVDCRNSASKMNQLISYFILQTRKRNVTLYFTTQDFNMTDLRLIRHTDIMVLCVKPIAWCKRNKKEIGLYRKYTILDFRHGRDVKRKQFIMYIKPWFNYYDTNEIILPPL